MRRPDNIAFGVNDPLPTKLALGLALQQLAFLGALMIIPDIYARAAGLEERSGFLDIASATLLVPRLGAASLICLVVAGQLVGSVVLDHYGVLHARQPVESLRIVGLLLVVAGAVLVVKPWQASGG